MKYTNLTSRILSAAAGAALCACGGAPAASPDAGNTRVESATFTGPAPSVSAPAAGYARAIAAAENAAATDPLCAPSVMGDFYWEIGGARAATPIASRSEGGHSVNADTRFNIASASKFVFGAYVLQKYGIDFVRSNPSLFAGVRFMSGYTGFDEQACVLSGTVGACFNAGMKGNTGAPNPATVGKFDYDGGHDQKLAAVDFGMADYTAVQVSKEYQSVLGLPADFSMAPLDPVMAGGLMANADEYAQFLRKIMNKQLVIGSHLGEDSVCALDKDCPGQVAYSPIAALGEPWRYSYNHWVESQYGNGSVDAYSSPGKWGFYPWITPDLQYYGIVSRHDTSPQAYAVSVKCGRQIRKAFLAAL